MLKASVAAVACAFSTTVALLSSVAHAEPRKPTHIACVGDSITAGTGASDPSKNYVGQLQSLEGNSVQVKNFGHSGATMLSAPFGDLPYTEQAEYTTATDFVNKAGAGAVVSVIIILGANDSKPKNWDTAGGTNGQQYLKDYRALVDHFAGLASKPVVYVAFPLATGTNPCCTIRGDVIHDQEIPLIKQVAMEKHLPIIDLNTLTTGHPEYFGDGVHPNDSGYAVMANLVKKGLEREPSVSITSPSSGATFSSGMLPLTAEVMAGDVDVASVEFFEGASSLGKVTTKPFTYTWAATPGAHSITAKATDATLANATSGAVAFTITDGAAGGAGAGTGGSAGAGGVAAVAGSAGNAGNGNQTAGGVGIAGNGSSGGGSASYAGSPAAATAGSAQNTPADASSGCSCVLPGSRPSRDFSGMLLLASVATLCTRRLSCRRAAPGAPRPTSTLRPRWSRPSARRA